MIDKRIGLVYNYWTILERTGKHRTNKVYLCKCICGIEKEVKFCGMKLQSKSCGCKKYEKRYKRPKGLKNKLKGLSNIFTRYIRESKERNINFELNEEVFLELIKSNCYYCEIQPSNKSIYNSYECIYNGIDRVDNSKGYIKENCVPCCKPCNIAKRAATPEIIYKAYHFLFKES